MKAPRVRTRCRTCEGMGEVTTGQAADGCFHDKPCPNRECEDGIVWMRADDLGSEDVEIDADFYPVGEAA